MILGQEDKPSLEELKHYGVKGMKWGVRRGGLGSRVKGALADHNQQQTAIATRMRENRSKGVDEKIGRALTRVAHPTTKGFNKTLDKRLGSLADQKKRIESGKLKINDLLDIAGHVTLADLVISRRDNKG